MRKMLLAVMLGLCTIMTHAKDSFGRQTINLSGVWEFSLDADASLNALSPLNDRITLPGTTDTNRKGTPCTDRSETTRLSRLYSYAGKAWYRREVTIPKTWRGRQVTLVMERTKPTTVFVDGRMMGHNNDISTAQRYDLTAALTPGRHHITIMVDNNGGVPRQIYANSHAYTEDTQTNWNGIIGRFCLEAAPQSHIGSIAVNASAVDRRVTARITLVGKQKKNLRLQWAVTHIGSGRKVELARTEVRTDGAGAEAVLTLNEEPLPWSEFHPDLYRLTAVLDGRDTLSEDFGFVDFKVRGTQFFVNNHLTFLRGKHDACVFPQTGHVPMTVEAWTEYLDTLRSYGINHVRFHSWCPPDAAFTAADRLGIYLQPELPFWGDFNEKDTTLMRFLHKEGENLIRAYGNHPSFVMMALGNELRGSIAAMSRFVSDFRALSPHRLYTFGSNFYLGFAGWKPGMDFFVTCRTGKEPYGSYATHTRGSFSFADAADGGVINHFPPNTSYNFDAAVAACPMPIISHETAQFQTYPDFRREIPQYRGVLYPYNMETFARRLQQAGMDDQAVDFHRASGAWSALLYKADIEMDLRTRGFDGFQLLDLQDYPGQGSAYVGILDANMQPKGIISRERWRGFCSPVVPLLISDKLTFTASETFKADVRIANYSEQSLRGATLRWKLTGPQLYYEGSTAINTDSTGLFNAARLNCMLNTCTRSQQLTLTLSVVPAGGGETMTNSYQLWVFAQPAAEAKTDRGSKPLVVNALDSKTARLLTAGASVLLMPDSAVNTVGALFTTDYWNYRMFKTISEKNNRPVSPGTLGLLIRPDHPAFEAFPTEEHTNWQWFPIIKASHPLILDRLPLDYRPIVQVIDNIERNHRLGLVMEFKVGKGRLLLCMSNLLKQLDHPESAALYHSLLGYMQSPRFAPTAAITTEALDQLLNAPDAEKQLRQLHNISY